MKIRVILLFLTLMTITILWSVSVDELENSFNNGTLHLNHADLRINPSEDPEINSAKLFFSAKLSKTTDKTIYFFQQAWQKYPETNYGKKSLLELAKIDFFNRSYEESLKKLNLIKNDPESEYWKLRIILLKKKYSDAVNLTSSIFKNYPDFKLIPEIYCLMLEMYRENNKPDEFNITRDNFRYHPSYLEYEPFVLYNEALLLEKQNLHSKAQQILTLLIEKYPDCQYRINADDKLLDINKILSQNKAELSETPQQLSQPQAPRESSSKTPVLDKLESGKPYVQYGLFALQKAAESYKKSLEAQGLTPFVIQKKVSDKVHYAVIQGPFKSKNDALDFMKRTKANNINSFLFFP